MKSKGEKFLDPSQLKGSSVNWELQARLHEPKKGVYTYRASDVEAVHRREPHINIEHSADFFNDVIPQMIAKKNPGEKVKILDVGAGVGAFTEQIRKKFGDLVQVYSTGLSKQAARAHRIRHNKLGLQPQFPKNLHPNELKWRSISELSKFEEFDLIIDTFGELYYAYNLERSIWDNEYLSEYGPGYKDYISMVAAKLLPGGQAFITPAGYFNLKDKFTRDFITGMEQEFGIKMSFNENRLKIKKSKKAE